MVNKKGGKKHKRNKNAGFQTKELRFKEEGQEYAQVSKCCGNCRFEVLCFDGIQRKATLCGAMRKRQFINSGQVVLVSLRDFEDGKCDIIDSYDDTQFRKLKQQGCIPESIKLEQDNEFEDLEDNGFDFEVSHNSGEEDEEDEEEIDLDEI